MKKYLKNNIYLLFAIILYFSGLMIEKYQIPRPNKNLVSKFEHVLHQKETKVSHLVDSVVIFIEHNEQLFDRYNLQPFDRDKIIELHDEGLSIYIFKDDTLKYWTDNSISLNEIYSKNDFTGKCCRWGNDIVDIETKQIYNYTILGVFKIKSKYKSENNYLKNEFHKDFDINQLIEISFIFTSEAIDIQDVNGDTLLYLSYADEAFLNPGVSWLLSIVYILCIFFLIIQANIIIYKFYRYSHKYILVLFSLLILIIVRIFLRIYQFPINIFSQDFFDSQYFACSWLNASLGDLMINLMMFFTISVHILKLLLIPKFIEKIYTKKSLKILLSAVIIFVGFAVFFSNIALIRNIIIDSTINLNLNDFQNINAYSLVAFICIVAIALLAVYTLIMIYEFVISVLSVRQVVIISLLMFVLAASGAYLEVGIFAVYSMIALALLASFIAYYKLKENKIKLYYYGLIGFIVSVLVTTIISISLNYKLTETYKLKALDLVNQRDDVGELILKNLVVKLQNDETLAEYANNQNIPKLQSKIKEYVKRKYFKSYWNKYDLSVVLCSKSDSVFMQNNIPINCHKYFNNLLQNSSEVLNFQNAYFINSNNLQNSYLLTSKYLVDDDSVTFFFTLTPKLYPSNIGYPELLLNNKNGQLKKDDYSYAKYIDNKLFQKSGDYNYPVIGKIFFNKVNEVYYLNESELQHIVYTFDEGNYLVVSFHRITLWNAIVTFSYLFLTFIIVVCLLYVVSDFSASLYPKNWNFKTQVIFSVLAVISLIFIGVGAGTIILNMNQYNSQRQNEVINKLKQINIALTDKYSRLDTITVQWNENHYNYLDIYLRKISEIVGTDINLYDVNGRILATSRPEIFSMKLISEHINPVAFYEMMQNNASLYVHKENISSMNYTSAYSQFFNKNNKLLAIINMPYFTNPNEFREKLTNLSITIVNIFVVFFVISVILSIFISEQIISPLKILRNKFKKLELGKKYEKIEYHRKDEIGDLVIEYNKMVEKLDESIVLLSKSERESAWRDMAKQIAHEIKNPLTPMKLSIQLLLRSWDNQDEDFDYRLRDVSNTLIQQIETLKRIAEEFSDFAKMPKPQEQVINISDKIEQMSKFYENTENVDVIANLNNFTDTLIIADDKQISRAFINLIKNAIQAIPDGIRGHILLDLDVYANKVVIKIVDNGNGIPDNIRDKLFLPSFTTKSSGMGIGLAMVKNIIQNANGKISFKSKIGEGTTFILEFPKYDPS